MVTYTVSLKNNPGSGNTVYPTKYEDTLPAGFTMTAAQVTAVTVAGGSGASCSKLSANFNAGTNLLTVNFGAADFINNSKSCTLTFSVTIGYGVSGSFDNPTQVWTVGYGSVANQQSKTETNQATVTVTLCDDAYESLSDDSSATTNAIGFGASNNQTHTISRPGDVDWTKLAMTAGHTYTISATSVGSSLNARIRLYDTDGVTLLGTANANGAGGSETLSYTAATGGVRYIVVDDLSGGGDCSNYGYTLGVAGSVTLSATGDNSIWAATSTTSYGTEQAIGIGNQTGQVIKSVLQFDLSGIPSSATVNSANMTLRTCNTIVVNPYGTVSCIVNGNAASANNIAVAAYRLLASWSEATSTWNVRSTGTNWNTAGASGSGTDYNSTVVSSVTVGASTNTNYTWSLTTAAQTWVSNSATNFGILLAPTTATVGNTNYRLFTSSEAASNQPSLVVTYS